MCVLYGCLVLVAVKKRRRQVTPDRIAYLKKGSRG